MDKQFLVVKVATELGSALSVIPVPGLFNRPTAEKVLADLHESEPEAVFLIQEVGAA